MQSISGETVEKHEIVIALIEELHSELVVVADVVGLKGVHSASTGEFNTNSVLGDIVTLNVAVTAVPQLDGDASASDIHLCDGDVLAVGDKDLSGISGDVCGGNVFMVADVLTIQHVPSYSVLFSLGDMDAIIGKCVISDIILHSSKFKS